METKRWNIKEMNDKIESVIDQAARLLKNGETVAFPTETVYGLGADATNNAAVEKIFRAKGRPTDNPLIAHVASKEQLKSLVSDLSPMVERLIDAFTPGPITFVLPSNGACATNVTANQPTIGVRIPSHPIALRLLRACAIPIAAPSANLSGKPSPTSADHVWNDLNGRIAGLLDDGDTGIGVESTVVDCTGDDPVILRPGGISKELIEAEIGYVLMDAGQPTASEKPGSPGMKYTHYAPAMPLWVIEGDAHDLQKVINKQKNKGMRIGVMASAGTINRLSADRKISLGDTLPDIAAHVYKALRSFHIDDVDMIISETFPDKGIGTAIMNRLHKASSTYVPRDREPNDESS